MAKRSRREIKRAVARLKKDCAWVPVAEMTDITHASPSVVIRWIVGGRNGVYLDGVKKRGEWHSSAAAWERFEAQEAAECRKGGVA